MAAIARQPAYQRNPRELIWERIVQWMLERLRDFYDFFQGSGVGRIVVIVLFSALVLLALARFFIAYRDERALQSRSVASGNLRPGVDYLREAERLAASGDYAGAAHLLFTALLDSFSRRGEVRIHASKTTGDYARELRRSKSPSTAGFHAFRTHYDRLVYRDVRIGEGDYRKLYESAAPLLELRKAA